jgi:Domain of unknown function (DUF1906)
MITYANLKEIGWGIAPIFVGRQTEHRSPGSSHELDEWHGINDPRQAARLAAEAGFPRGSVMYLHIEAGGGPLDPDLATYYEAWVAQMIADGQYYPGVYCSYQVAPQLRGLDSRPRWWVFHVTHGCDPGFPHTYDFFPNELVPYMNFPTTQERVAGWSLNPRNSFAYARMRQWGQSIPSDGVPCSLVIDGEEYLGWDFNTATLKDPSDPTLSF